MSLSAKLYALIAIFFLSMFSLMVLSSLDTKETLFADRQIKTQNLVENAYSIIEHFYKLEQAGALSQADAQSEALKVIKGLSYDGNNYFWVNDYTPTMVMHPKKPALDGKDLSGVKDPNGTALFLDMVAVVKAEGAGFVPYMWSKPGKEGDADVVAPKISYVQGFEPWQWIVGTGIYVDDVQEAFYKNLQKSGLIFLGFIIVIGACSFFLLRSIKKPIISIANIIEELSQDKFVEIPPFETKDEIGAIAKATEQLNIYLEQARIARTEQEASKARSEEEKQEAIKAIAEQFDQQVGVFVQSLTTASGDLELSAQNMQKISSLTLDSSRQVVQGSDSASQNVNILATAMEEMSASIAEITQQVSAAQQQSNETSQSAEHANILVGRLTGLVDNIGEVVTAIQDIAEQTNLLALNATIESARAGDAGKGFAVVAEEVKKLASETAMKTEEINTRITDIQSATHETVQAMNRIIKNISEIDLSVTNISHAVTEQNSATSEIAQNITKTSCDVGEVAKVIVNVEKCADEAGQSADVVMSSSDKVSSLTTELSEAVGSFLTRLKA